MSALMDMLPQYATLSAAIGTASSGLVDASKTVFGGTSNYGYFAIKKMARQFIPNGIEQGTPTVPGFDTLKLSLRANWLNGTPLEQQKANAKAQIKLRLNLYTAATYARITTIDEDTLKAIANKIATNTVLENIESSAWSRFDFILTSILDECYARADQHYRNFSKGTSAITSVILALLGYLMYPSAFDGSYWLAALVGLAATPFGPIAKDLTTKLSDVAKAVQSLRK